MDPLDEEDTGVPGRGRGSKGLQRTLKLEGKQAENGTEDTDSENNSDDEQTNSGTEDTDSDDNAGDEQTNMCNLSAQTGANRASQQARLQNRPRMMKRDVPKDTSRSEASRAKVVVNRGRVDSRDGKREKKKKKNVVPDEDVEEEAENDTEEGGCGCVPTKTGVRVGDTVVHVNDLGEEVQCKVVSVDASSNNCTVEPVKIGEATSSPNTAANENEEKSDANNDSPSDQKPKSDTVCWTTIVYGYFEPGEVKIEAPAHLRVAKALMCM